MTDKTGDGFEIVDGSGYYTGCTGGKDCPVCQGDIIDTNEWGCRLHQLGGTCRLQAQLARMTPVFDAAIAYGIHGTEGTCRAYMKSIKEKVQEYLKENDGNMCK